ncbi:uncharacterized protein [Oscarella lobularis]|uniref:uncharacterized protein n=1 Tax=Oscarella lobularis TaxID=121494 RepID=UPI003313D8EC
MTFDIFLSSAFVLQFSLVAVSASRYDCRKTGTCSCAFENGSTIDLSPLQASNRSQVPRFRNVKDNGENTFDFNPCFDFTNEKCKNTTVCLIPSGVNVGINIGQSEGNQFGLTDGGINDPTPHVIITYMGVPTDNITQNSKVILQCNSDVEGHLEAYGENLPNEYEFVLVSKHCCPVGGGTPLSPGSISIIVVFVFVLVYLIVGALYMKAGKGASGRDVIPNYSFWASLPGLCKDGVKFTFCCGNIKPEYQKIT